MRRFFRRARLDEERAREMQAHIDHHVDDLVAGGLTPDEAFRVARRRFGNPTAIREEIYGVNTIPVIDSLVRDLRYAWRMLRKSPGFTMAVVLTLGLGVGANTALFSVVDTLLFQPLPYPQPDRLGLLHRRVGNQPSGDVGADGRMWFAVRDHTNTVDAAVAGGTTGVNLVADHLVAYVQQQRVSADYFNTLGIPPLMGREFTRAEDEAGGPAVVVLSNSIWTRFFDSDPSVLGRTITLKGEPHTVVGVLPKDFPITQRVSFAGGEGVDVWTPLRPNTNAEGGGINYNVIARLKDGVSWVEAQTDVVHASPLAFPSVPAGTVVELGWAPMQMAMTAGLRQPLLMLWGAVGIVLLIACVNIAGLLLARGATRTREIATRMALGGSRAAVIRQLLVESLVLAFFGGALGLVVGSLVLTVLGTLGAQVFELWQPLTLNARVMAGSLSIALATSVIFGLAPALQASRVDVRAGLLEGGARAVAGASSHWSRRALVVAEVSLGVVLMVSAGLLVRTFVHLRDLPAGFDERNLTTVSVSLQDARYRDPAAIEHLFDETLRRIRAVPGVEGAGAALGMPYTRLLNNGVRRVDGPQIDPTSQGLITNMSYVTPGYFEALKVPLRQGRLLADADTSSSPLVALVNEAFVERFYKDDSIALGRHVWSGSQAREIVGVVGNIQQASAGWGNLGPISPLPCIYIPVSQTTTGFLTMVHTWFQPSWAVRSTLPSVAQDIRQAIESVDAQLPVAQVQTIDDLRGEKLAAHRFMMGLVAGLGFLALLLSAIGLHGLIASSVSERTRELGIRMALGASAGQAMRAVVVPGVLMACLGVMLGTAGAVAATRLLKSFLWGVTAGDPVTFIAVAVTLIIVAVVASVLPALRVLRLDPALTLRAE